MSFLLEYVISIALFKAYLRPKYTYFVDLNFFSFVNLIAICNLYICEEIWHLDLGRKKKGKKKKIGN